MNFETTAVKSTYKFNEVTSVTGVKPYVLRFWETEFEQISPSENEAGQKIYSQDDIDSILKIKKLLFEDKMSIPQARHSLNGTVEQEQVVSPVSEVNTTEQETPKAAPSLQENSLDLKKALEDIIEKNSKPKEDFEHEAANDKAQNVVEKVKENFIQKRNFQEQDVVNLVSAKKKLTVLMGRIDKICADHNW
jgi:DNA-binding transcriptional MerR regulator